MRQPLSPRGTSENPANRFEPLHVEPGDADGLPCSDSVNDDTLPTLFYRDTSKSVVVANDSPDVGFRYSVNPYRGCEHGCVYCYARPTHEYLGFSAGLDFERRVMVKRDAPELLRRALAAPRWQPQTVALSGNTDCYQPVERQLRLTRRCLEVLAEFRNPVSVATKSALVTRDRDLLQSLAAHGAAHVALSLTTLDGELARRLEPRAAHPEKRLEALRVLSAAGIPTSVMVAPVIPGLTDEEMPRVLHAAAAAGVRSASWILLRLPPPVDTLFERWRERHFPERRQRVLGRIRACRRGRLSDHAFGRRMRGEGRYAEHIGVLFDAVARRLGLDRPLPALNPLAFRRPGADGKQLRLY